MHAYNRYTPADQQDQLSIEAKGEGVLLYGELAEKIAWIKDNLVYAGHIYTQRIVTNLMIAPSKKNFIHHLISLYEHRAKGSSKASIG